MPRLICILSVILFMVLSSAHAQPRLTTPDLSGYAQVRYVSVDTGSDSTGDGSQAKPWQTLSNALTQITDAAQTKTYAVLIASGTYTGTGETAFLAKQWVDLWGGYDPVLWERGNKMNQTFLDGENSRRVLNGASNSVIDGLVITRGTSLGASIIDGGGIMYKDVAAATLSNCIIRENYAFLNGGGITSYNSSPKFLQCLITTNDAENGGGGVYIIKSSAQILSCTITHNSATDSIRLTGAGGIYTTDSSLNIYNSTISFNQGGMAGGILCKKGSLSVSDCQITFNTAFGPSQTGGGGGVFCTQVMAAILEDCQISGNEIIAADGLSGGGGIGMDASSPIMSNCTITQNQFTGMNINTGGGGIFCGADSSPDLINCTIAENESTSSGGVFSNGSSPQFLNTILWNHGIEVFSIGSGTSTATYSCVQGGMTGIGNIDSDPLFVNAPEGDFHLQPTSPCINKGIGPTVNSSVPITDIDGDPRSGDTCDIGADEFFAPTLILEWANY